MPNRNLFSIKKCQKLQEFVDSLKDDSSTVGKINFGFGNFDLKTKRFGWSKKFNLRIEAKR